MTITENNNLTVLSILASSGPVTITGSKMSGASAPAPITLLQGQAVTINGGKDETLLITGVTITTAGTANLIGR